MPWHSFLLNYLYRSIVLYSGLSREISLCQQIKQKSIILCFFSSFLFFGCSQDNYNESRLVNYGKMVRVPAGTFIMGGNSGQSSLDEFPRHRVKVDSFYMDVHEVTNRQFRKFVDKTGYVTIAEKEIDWLEMKKELPVGTRKPSDEILQPGSLVFRSTDRPVALGDETQWWAWTIGTNWRKPEGPGSNIEDKMDHPVVHVAWEDAIAYARWSGKRLPTEAEWEWAARGGLNNPIYPWGDKSASKAASKANFWQGQFPYKNTLKDGFYGTAPVMSYMPNGYGLHDMAGNVWEWCADLYHFGSYKIDLENGFSINPSGPEESYDPLEPHMSKRVIRGGSFLCNDSYCSGYRVSRRMKSSQDTGLSHTGFRCVKSVE